MSDENPLQTGLERILEHYGAARREGVFGRDHHIWSVFERLASAIRLSTPFVSAKNTILRWSAGQGRWATVPWIAVFDERETSRISEGVYVIYLFRADQEGVYLTVNQGASWALVPGTGRGGLRALRERAQQLRERLAGLRAEGFDLESVIDLGSSIPLIKAYQASTIASKYYVRGAVPHDKALRRDLGCALAAYQRIVPTSRLP